MESSELLELFQWINQEEINTTIKDKEYCDQIMSELSDIIIYCFSLSNRLDRDLSEAVMNKIKENNEKKMAEKLKGKYIKYDKIDKINNVN